MTERDYRNAVRKDGKAKTHESMNTTDFPEWLRTEIMKLGISQRQLSKELHVDESIVSRWMNGERFPTVKQVLTLSDFMRVSTDTIMAKK
jgi:ribosome-binding protein aMBF1 (putative translation factor)